MGLTPVPLTIRQKKFVLLSSCVMVVSGVVVLVVVGIIKGYVLADGAGIAAIVVGGANAWLSRRAPTRGDPKVQGPALL
jgi:hypothetical protein